MGWSLFAKWQGEWQGGGSVDWVVGCGACCTRDLSPPLTAVEWQSQSCLLDWHASLLRFWVWVFFVFCVFWVVCDIEIYRPTGLPGTAGICQDLWRATVAVSVSVTDSVSVSGRWCAFSSATKPHSPINCLVLGLGLGLGRFKNIKTHRSSTKKKKYLIKIYVQPRMAKPAGGLFWKNKPCLYRVAAVTAVQGTFFDDTLQRPPSTGIPESCKARIPGILAVSSWVWGAVGRTDGRTDGTWNFAV